MSSESATDKGSFSSIQVQLEQYLPYLNEGEPAYRFYELCGFMAALCSSPELIRPDEWLPVIIGDSMEIPEAFDPDVVLSALLDLYNWVNNRVLSCEPPLPPDLVINTHEPFANFGEDADVGQWSRGFFEGHDWLAEVWEHFINDELEKELSSYMMPLTFFIDENFARALYEDFVRQDSSFEDVADVLINLFVAASRDYANLGRTLAEALEALDTKATLSGGYDDGVIDPDAPCPCGSGKIYRKCCLH